MRFVEARFKTVTSGRRIRLQVMHVMVAPEKPGTAEAVASWWNGPTSPRTSAHYCYDNDSEVQCVRDQDVAYAAPGANHDGLHHELAGYPHQTAQEWRDPYSDAMLARAAINVSQKCEDYDNPKTWLSDREIELGKSGICDHWAISRVYKRSTHWDVGPNFPKDFFVDIVRAASLAAPNPAGGLYIMQDCVAAIECPVDGGYQKLQADGGVFNSDGCNHFHGSWHSPEMLQHHNDPNRVFVDIVRIAGTTGYTIVSRRGEPYRFAAQ